MMKRRSFLKKAAASGSAAFGFQIVPAHVARGQAAGGGSPNGKLRIAAVGCGGRGASNLGEMAGEDIVALCDVDARRAGEMFSKFPDAKRYTDFRVMFDEMEDKIDAVLVATPDHTHAVPVLSAINRGKHVYCEKPLAHTFEEVRAMRKAAAEKGVITQVGNQGHSADHIRLFVEWVRGGAIGKVHEAHLGCDAFKEVYCQIGKHPDLLSGNHKVPDELDWNLWLGPVPERPYHPAYVPFSWRGFSAFGSGVIGDWVCHVFDPIFWALELGLPSAITAETTGYDPDKDADYYPKGARITYEFAADGDRGPLKVVWHDGDFRIPRPPELEEGRDSPGTGGVIYGDAGTIMHGSHGAGGCRIIPEARMKEAGKTEETIPRLRKSHQQDWIDAVKEGRPAGSDFEYGGALSEIGLLGMVAIRRSGHRLEWDADHMRFANDEAANALLRTKYRDGWDKV